MYLFRCTWGVWLYGCRNGKWRRRERRGLFWSRVEEGKGDDGEARRASRVDPPDFFFTMGPRFSAGERFWLSHAGKGARSEGRGGEVVVQVWWVCSHPCVSLWAQILCKRGGVRRVAQVVEGGGGRSHAAQGRIVSCRGMGTPTLRVQLWGVVGLQRRHRDRPVRSKRRGARKAWSLPRDFHRS